MWKTQNDMDYDFVGNCRQNQTCKRDIYTGPHFLDHNSHKAPGRAWRTWKRELGYRAFRGAHTSFRNRETESYRTYRWGSSGQRYCLLVYGRESSLYLAPAGRLLAVCGSSVSSFPLRMWVTN
jgi:hypothetical protein